MLQIVFFFRNSHATVGLRFLLLNAGFEAQKAGEDSRTSSSGETGWSTGELMVQKSGEAAAT